MTTKWLKNYVSFIYTKLFDQVCLTYLKIFVNLNIVSDFLLLKLKNLSLISGMSNFDFLDPGQ